MGEDQLRIRNYELGIFLLNYMIFSLLKKREFYSRSQSN